MRIGDLVKWMTFTDERFWLAIIVGETFDDMGTPAQKFNGSQQICWSKRLYLHRRFVGGSMKIGDVVEYDDGDVKWLAIVISEI